VPRPARKRSQSRPGRSRPSRHVDWSDAPKILDESDLGVLLEKAGGSGRVPLVLVLDGVQDPHNLGACLRTADAAGVDAVVVPKDRAVQLTETVRQVASGAAEKVPFVAVTNLARALKLLQEAGLWLTGTADEAVQSIYDIDFKGPTAIVMGAEGAGLRRLTGECCDHLVGIPMHGSVGCLNVSVATGVCLFEVVRQRSVAG
jgi:23S rRNA (guanosine2251-2'-O)-methyltransferase